STGASSRPGASCAVQNSSANQIAMMNSAVTRSRAVKYPELKKLPMPENGPELDVDEVASNVTPARSLGGFSVGWQRLRVEVRHNRGSDTRLRAGGALSLSDLRGGPSGLARPATR